MTYGSQQQLPLLDSMARLPDGASVDHDVSRDSAAHAAARRLRRRALKSRGVERRSRRVAGFGVAFSRTNQNFR